MGHVHHQLRIDRVRDLAEPGKVYLARISRAAGNDQLGMIFAGEFGDGIIVDPLVSLADSILDGVQPFARKGGCCAMGEMAAMRERSEEHTSELQSLMRLSYAVFCLKK